MAERTESPTPTSSAVVRLPTIAGRSRAARRPTPSPPLAADPQPSGLVLDPQSPGPVLDPRAPAGPGPVPVGPASTPIPTSHHLLLLRTTCTGCAVAGNGAKSELGTRNGAELGTHEMARDDRNGAEWESDGAKPRQLPDDVAAEGPGEQGQSGSEQQSRQHRHPCVEPGRLDRECGQQRDALDDSDHLP